MQLPLVEMFCAYLALIKKHEFLRGTDSEEICVSVWHKAKIKTKYNEQEKFNSAVD